VNFGIDTHGCEHEGEGNSTYTRNLSRSLLSLEGDDTFALFAGDPGQGRRQGSDHRLGAQARRDREGAAGRRGRVLHAVDKIQTLLASTPAVVETMRAACRARAHDLSVERAVSGIVEVYERVRRGASNLVSP